MFTALSNITRNSVWGSRVIKGPDFIEKIQ